MKKFFLVFVASVVMAGSLGSCISKAAQASKLHMSPSFAKH